MQIPVPQNNELPQQPTIQVPSYVAETAVPAKPLIET